MVENLLLVIRWARPSSKWILDEGRVHLNARSKFFPFSEVFSNFKKFCGHTSYYRIKKTCHSFANCTGDRTKEKLSFIIFRNLNIVVGGGHTWKYNNSRHRDSFAYWKFYIFFTFSFSKKKTEKFKSATYFWPKGTETHLIRHRCDPYQQDAGFFRNRYFQIRLFDWLSLWSFSLFSPWFIWKGNQIFEDVFKKIWRYDKKKLFLKQISMLFCI